MHKTSNDNFCATYEVFSWLVILAAIPGTFLIAGFVSYLLLSVFERAPEADIVPIIVPAAALIGFWWVVPKYKLAACSLLYLFLVFDFVFFLGRFKSPYDGDVGLESKNLPYWLAVISATLSYILVWYFSIKGRGDSGVVKKLKRTKTL